jgi:lipoyl(octanoyl) transferase
LSAHSHLLLRQLGRQDYAFVWRAMRAFTDSRDSDTPSELWLVEHPPVFTQGQAGRSEHLLNPGDIPVVQSDRGGQVTYHGPGQVVLYVLLDLRRAGLGIRALVSRMEEAVIELLATHGVTATARPDAPGVYVDDAKIASLGLRVRHGRSYHGLALNVDMDLSPFGRINPCGHQGLAVTQLTALSADADPGSVGPALAEHLADRLGMTLAATSAPNPALVAEAIEPVAG